MLLVDTSAWVEVFRRPARLTIDELGGLDELVTCLSVIQEVLQGFHDERAFRLARESMFALPIVESPLGRDVVEEGVELYRFARRGAFAVRSSVDCLIAACALRHGLTVVHRDRDFAAIARVSALRHRDLAGS